MSCFSLLAVGGLLTVVVLPFGLFSTGTGDEVHRISCHDSMWDLPRRGSQSVSPAWAVDSEPLDA